MSTANQSNTAMSVFIPRSVAAYESAAERWHGRFYAPTQMLAARTLGFAERLMSSWLGSFHFGFNLPTVPRANVAPMAMNVVQPWYDLPTQQARPAVRPATSSATAPAASASQAAPSTASSIFEEMVTLTLPPEALSGAFTASGSVAAPVAAPAPTVERRVREFFPEIVRPAASLAPPSVAATPFVPAALRAASAAEPIGLVASTVAAPLPLESAAIGEASVPGASAGVEVPSYAPRSAADYAAPAYVYQPTPTARALYHLAWADAQLSRSPAAGSSSVGRTSPAATMLPSVAQATSPLAAAAMEAPEPLAQPRLTVRDGFVYLQPAQVPLQAPAQAALRTALPSSIVAAAAAVAPLSGELALPFRVPSPIAPSVSADLVGAEAAAPIASPSYVAALSSPGALGAAPAAAWQAAFSSAAPFAAPMHGAASLGSVALGGALRVQPTAIQQAIGNFLAARLSTQTLADVGAGPSPEAIAVASQPAASRPELVALLPLSQPMAPSPASAALPARTGGAAQPSLTSVSALAAPAVSSTSAAAHPEAVLASFASAAAAPPAASFALASSLFRPGQLGVGLESQVQSIVAQLGSSWGYAAPAPAQAETRRFVATELAYLTPPEMFVPRPEAAASLPPVQRSAVAPIPATLPAGLEWLMPALSVGALPVAELPSTVSAVAPGAMLRGGQVFLPSLAAQPEGVAVASAAAPASGTASAAIASPTMARAGVAPSFAYVAPASAGPAASAPIASPRGYATEAHGTPALASLWAALEAQSGAAAVLSFVERMPALSTFRALQPTSVEAASFVASSLSPEDAALFEAPQAPAARTTTSMPVVAPSFAEPTSPLGGLRSPTMATLAPPPAMSNIVPSAAAVASAAPAPRSEFMVRQAPPGASAVQSEALAAAVALRSSGLAAEFVDPMVLTLLHRELGAAAPASPMFWPVAAQAPSMALAAPAVPPAAAPPFATTSAIQARLTTAPTSVMLEAGFGFQAPLLSSSAPLASQEQSVLFGAPSAHAVSTSSAANAAMPDAEWALFTLFPSASTAAEVGLTARSNAASSVAPASARTPAMPALSAIGLQRGEGAMTASPAAPGMAMSGAAVAAASSPGFSSLAADSPWTRGPELVRLPTGSQPRGGFLWPSSATTSYETPLIDPEAFTNTPVQAQLVTVAGRQLDAIQPLWELLRPTASSVAAPNTAPVGAPSASPTSELVAAEGWDAGTAPSVAGPAARAPQLPPVVAAMAQASVRLAQAAQLASGGGSPHEGEPTSVGRLQPVLDLLRGAPSAAVAVAPANDAFARGGGESAPAPTSIRYEQALPVVAAQPSSEAAASIVHAVRQAGPSSPTEDRLTLADLTLITMATATQNFAAAPEGGGPSGGGGGDSGAAPGSPAAAGAGGGGAGEAPAQIEELARQVYEAYLRLIEIQRERSGESWEL